MELDPGLMRLVGMARGFDAALATLGDTLRAAQFEANLDLEKPSAAEVRLGLASRRFRLLSYLAGNFGAGRLKLRKLHLEDFVDGEELTAEFEAHLAYLEARVNRETLEEFQDVDLGGDFSRRSIRQMARGVGPRRFR